MCPNAFIIWFIVIVVYTRRSMTGVSPSRIFVILNRFLKNFNIVRAMTYLHQPVSLEQKSWFASSIFVPKSLGANVYVYVLILPLITNKTTCLVAPDVFVSSYEFCSLLSCTGVLCFWNNILLSWCISVSKSNINLRFHWNSNKPWYST